MKKVKFSLFSDIHHFPGVFRSNTPDNLIRIQQRAREENVDFIIHCGDMTHVPTAERDFMALYNDFEIPSYNCLGNHDTDGSTLKDTLEIYRMPNNYYSFDVNGFRMIVLDTNYLKHEGRYVHFDLGNYFRYPGERDWMPDEELDWLAQELESADGRCVLFNHSSVERCDGVRNRDRVRAVLNDVNRRHPGRVTLFANGHFHRDAFTILDGIPYFEVNSASYDWIGEMTHDHYPAEERKRYRLLDHTVCWDDPVHAIVTLTEDGDIDIKGMESRMWLGINREDTTAPVYDAMGRPVTPRVSDVHIRLK